MRNTLPPLAYTQILETSLAGEMGVSVEGSNGSVSGDNYYNVGLSNNTLVLPPIDPYGPASRWIVHVCPASAVRRAPGTSPSIGPSTVR